MGVIGVDSKGEPLDAILVSEMHQGKPSCQEYLEVAFFEREEKVGPLCAGKKASH